MFETVVIRHPKENLAKCSLTPLEGQNGYRFFIAEPSLRFDATGYTLLAVDAPALSEADSHRPLLCLDATWQRLPQVLTSVVGQPVARSMPAGIRTAYPRVNRDGNDPQGGLASIEALFVAHVCLGRQVGNLLAGYYWRDAFLAGLPPSFLARAHALGLPRS
ncbi:MAG: hypothetical protein VX589_07840 [Myxococcota bacterium]|nr:hypothetical protein [Myxococcota bacterium]